MKEVDSIAFPHADFGFKACPDCDRVSADPDHVLVALALPMPCCGSTGKLRFAWPSVEAIQYLRILKAQDLDDKFGRRIASVFLASLCELLLEDVLWRRLGELTSSVSLAEAVLDGYRGADRRRTLLRKLHRAPSEILEENGFGSFYSAWTSVERARNNYAHGSFSPEQRVGREIIELARAQLLPAFAALHNDVVVAPTVESTESAALKDSPSSDS